jgi:PAS domain S-box-containing protein
MGFVFLILNHPPLKQNEFNMTRRNLNKFFAGIVAPSILAIILFVISFFVIILPQFEKNMMDRKKEMIRELTNTAWSILEENQLEHEKGNFTQQEAKQMAANQIELMRYGKERKDYFWIIDYTPKMIMHPYRKELNNKNLEDFKDTHEKTLFVDAVNLVQLHGEGFIDYYWQWKDDASKVVPKLSFVKKYDPWNWIIGTGIYLDDVNKEIAYLKSRLLAISSIIIGIIVIVLIYIVRQSLAIENKRKTAEVNLVQSRQKYKTLVDASTEGTLMFVNNRIIFNNLKFAAMVNCASSELTGLTFNEVFTVRWADILALFSDPKKSVTTETHIQCNNTKGKEVVLSVSRIDYNNQEAFIVIAKDVSQQKQLEKGAQHLSQELQTSLLLMNQPIKTFVKEVVSCEADESIRDVSIKMTNKKLKFIAIKQNNTIIGVVNDSDLRTRVLAKDVDPNQSIIEIMSAPVVKIPERALAYEAILQFKRERVSHLLVTDTNGRIVGVIGNQDVLEMQRNSLSYLIREIETSEQIDELKQIYQRIPSLVNAIINSSDNPQNTTRIITSVADAISKRVIDFAIEQHGTPPCSFAFIALGSEGRMEQTLKTDQDNAIVMIDSATDDDKSYFHQLAETINRYLHLIGFHYCEGEIMASNPKWCQTSSIWKSYFTSWINSPDPQNVLDSSIFYDLRYVYGDRVLVDELRAFIHENVKENGLFFYHMAHAIIKYKVSIDGETVNLKKVILPLIGFVRIYALQNLCLETNTITRLEALTEKGVFSAEQKKEWTQIYNFLMQHRLKTQAQALMEQESPGNTIEYRNLLTIEQNTLKKAHKEIGELQMQLSLVFKRGT